MSDFFEIDFMDVESKKSGDAIAVRYELDGEIYIHVVDAGFQESGTKIAEKINSYYDNPKFIDHVVATHNDNDHSGGLRTILEEFEVGKLWMLRPWLYAEELIDQFDRYTNVENLRKRLREVYSNLAALEEIALDKGIDIEEAFQGTKIGEFTVMSPSKSRYLNLILESEKTPDATVESDDRSLAKLLLDGAITMLKAAWGVETFSDEETSSENEMSIVQYAKLCDSKILLTADTGRAGLQEVIDYAPSVGLVLPGINRFQVPHHGSRRNVSSETLDSLLGPKLASQPNDGEGSFTAVICASTEDKDHPRKAVVRAMIHRGAKVYTSANNLHSFGGSVPSDRGWSSATPSTYPTEQEG